MTGNPRLSNSESRLLFVALLLYLATGLAYSLLVPIWEAPDEPLHYRYALLLARENRQPENAENSESFQPPLYYFLASMLLRLMDRIDPVLVDFYSPGVVDGELYRYIAWDAGNSKIIWGALALRWFNMFLGAGSLVFIFLAVRLIHPNQPDLAAGALLFVGLLPQFIHNTTSVSNDALAIFGSSMLFWFSIRMLIQEPPAQTLIQIVFFALVLPLVTKLTALPIGLAATGAAFWKLRSSLPGLDDARHLVWGGFGLLAVVGALFWILPTAMENLWLEIVWRLTYVRPNIQNTPLWQTLYVYGWSFWGRLGWRDVGLLIPAVILLSTLAISGLVASFIRCFQRPDSFSIPDRRSWLFLYACLAMALLILTKNYFTSPQAQGRFLFPIIGPISVLVVGGWHALIGPRYQKWIPVAIGAIMVALNGYLLIFQVVPIYFQPFLDG